MHKVYCVSQIVLSAITWVTLLVYLTGLCRSKEVGEGCQNS